MTEWLQPSYNRDEFGHWLQRAFSDSDLNPQNSFLGIGKSQVHELQFGLQ